MTSSGGFRPSPQQRRLWQLQTTLGERPFRARALARIRGRLDLGLLREAVEQVAGRFEILRTTFPCPAGLTLPVQRVADQPAVAWYETLDLSSLDAGEREPALDELFRRVEEEPFDFVCGPLLRLAQAVFSEDEHALVLLLPALCADAVTLRNLVHQIAASYAILCGAAPEPEGASPLQYVDLAEWQNELLEDTEMEAGREHWETWDPAVCRTLRLPFENARTARNGFEPRSLSVPLDNGLAQRAAGLAGELDASLPTLLLAAWQSLLWRLLGQPEIVVGLSAQCRSYEGLSESLGPLASFVPISCRFDGDLRFVDAVTQVQGAVQAAAEWQEYFRWESVAERHGLTLDQTVFPLSFAVQEQPTPWRAGLLDWALPLCEAGIDRFRLGLNVRVEGGLPFIELALDAAMVSRDDVEGLARSWRALLASAVARPEARLDELALAGPAERLQFAWAETCDGGTVPALVHEHFMRQARRVPNRAAVVCAGRSISYGELAERVRRLSCFLRRHAVGPDVLVALCLERSLTLPLAILGVLGAGGAYLPLEPTLPRERKSFLLNDARPKMVLTETRFLPGLPAAAGVSVLCLDGAWEAEMAETASEPDDLALDSANLAYVIYTSGSTGAPKGVAVEHRQLANYAQGITERLDLPDGAAYAMVSTFAADLGNTVLFPSLCSGGTLHMIPEELSSDPVALAAVLDRDPVDCLKITPSHLKALLAGAPSPGLLPRRCLVLGGEASHREWVESLAPLQPGLRVLNHYGPTETTVGVLTYQATPGGLRTATLPLGRPLPGTTARLLGEDLTPLPAWFHGEIYLGGAGVARGYLGRPDLTADRFVPDPLAGVPGARMYRTGDLARRLPEGPFEFIGRADHQVKIRGFRIELGEIETVLEADPEVRRAAVAACDDGSGSQRLMAYVVARPATRSADLRERLRERLPEFMIPSAFVLLDALPLNANGKVDRLALPEPDWRHLGTAEEFVAPETATEEILARVWADVLGVERVGTHDNFFHLGGDSIRGIVTRARAEEQGVVFSIEQLFEHPVLRDIARVAGERDSPAPSQTGTEPFSLLAEDDRARLPEGVEDAYPLSQLQAGMLFHSELAPGAAIYHDLHSFHAKAVFAPDRMREAVRHISLRHPVLRTSFDVATFSEPLQLVHAGISVPLEVQDLRQVPPEEQEAAVSEWLRQERQRAFDWKRPPLLGFHVHLRTETSFQFTMSFHHAVLDGWSAASLLTELFQLYSLLLREEAPPAGVPVAVTYRDFIALERAAVASGSARSFWSRLLDGAESTRLPRPSPPAIVPAPEAGVRAVHSWIDPALSDGAKRVAREVGVPLKSLLLAVHLRVASALGGTRDVLTGLISHGRPEHTDGERVLGLFLNTLPFRADLHGGTWCDLAEEVFELERKMLPFRRFPFSEMRGLKSSLKELELAYNYMHYHVYGGTAGGREVEILGRHDYEETNFPLVTHVSLNPFSQHLHIRLLHRTPDLDPGEAERFSAYMLRALVAMVEDPASRYDVPLLSAAERHQLLTEWNDTAAGISRESVLALIEEQVDRTPSAVAVVCEGESLTYAALDAAANRLANRLRSLGMGLESLVGVAMERSCELVVALLGTLKTGAAYMPLDPGHPQERLATMTADSGARVLLSQKHLVAALSLVQARVLYLNEPGAGLAAGSPERPGVAIEGANAAYVIHTSGSTGKPKGVVNTHRGLLNRLLWMQASYGLGPEDRVLQKTPFGFDVSVWEFFWPLMTGARLVMARPDGHRDPKYLAGLIAREEVTTLHFVPSMLQIFLAEPSVAHCRSLRLVFASGEALSSDLQQRFYQRFALPGVELHNLYGPTEAAIDVTSWPCRRWSEPSRVPIGRPVANTVICILDSWLQPVALGMPGDLCIGGVQLARGYSGRPDLTADRFIPDPASGALGQRLYRTGDVARFLPDGAIEYLGRTDFQVKIRGVRIELGEIEATLLLHDGVREAVVVAQQGEAPGEDRLIAFVVGTGGRAPVPAELLGFLRERLPEYMVPSALVPLDVLPLTSSGKLDRRGLPVPEPGQRLGTDFAAPRGPVEEMVAAIWTEVLGRGSIGIHESFFEVGGHSLLATRAMSRVRSAFGIDLPLRALFEAPTVARFSRQVEAAWREGRSKQAPPLLPQPKVGEAPLSFAQQRLWFIDQLEPGSPLYNLGTALRVEGPLDGAVLALSFGTIVRRHEALRTVFVSTEGSPAQVIRPAAPFGLALVDLSGLPERAREALAVRLTRDEADRPFDLTCGPLFRGVLLRLADEDHVVALTMHHIVSDGWSLGILVREVAALYPAFAARRPSSLPEIPVQYADFSAWQRSWLQGEALENEIAFWRRQLAGLPPRLELPTDRPRPAEQSFRGATRRVWLPAELTRQVETLGRHGGATLFMVLLAGFQALLSGYSGQQDLAIGTPVAGRNRMEIEGLIGFFVNTLVLRGDLTGEPSFRGLLDRVRETSLTAYMHQDLPFEKLVEELAPERSLSHSPLFQVMLALQNAPAERLEIQDLRLRRVTGGGRTAKFDLTLSLEERNGALLGAFEHATDLFDTTTIDRLAAGFERLLAAALAAPDRKLFELPLLGEAERQQTLVEWNDTWQKSLDGALVHEAISSRAERVSGATAVAWDGGEMTYRDLERRSNQLARRLRRLGVGPEVFVGLCCDRSGDLVMGILGILKAGGAYVPLDPEYPEGRLRQMLADCGAPVLVAQERAGSLAAATGTWLVSTDAPEPTFGPEDHGPLAPAALPEHPAYVIYTSGSTGRPKGVVVTHGALANSTRARLAFYREPVETYLLASSFAFDSSVAGLFWTLCDGGTLVLHRDQSQLDLPDFLATLAHRRASHLLCLPSLYSLILEHARPGQLDSLKTVIVAGEACPSALAAQHAVRLPAVALVNEYGPTEGTVWSSAQTLAAAPPSRLVSIGRPIGNVRLYLLDCDLGPVPAGVHGELWIGGVSLARGYLDSPDLTAERFLPDPFSGSPGARMYRTGDRMRRLPDGSLDFLGRLDYQVKVRGFRIEPGEIEAALMLQPGVSAAVVVSRRDGPSSRLVAYVVPGEGEGPSPAVLREALLVRLPDYMVPAAWVVLPSLPSTVTGKVDRRALPEPEAPTRGLGEPRSPIEQALTSIWAQLLRRDRVGIHDNFFELGGDSILSIQVCARAMKAGVRISPRLLFQHQTVAELAAVADALGAVEAEQGPVAGPAPLTPIQRWFFAEDVAEPHHFNQAVLFETTRRLDPVLLGAALARIERHHDALRLRFNRGEAGWRQAGSPPGVRIPLTVVDLAALPAPARPQAVRIAVAEAQASLDLEQGPLHRALLLDPGPQEPGRFFWAIHHLAVDGVSWRLLLEDLAALYEGAGLPAKTTSFRHWAEGLSGHAGAPETEAELSYWLNQPGTAAARLPLDHPAGLEANTVASASSVSLSLDAEETRALLQEVPQAYNTRINDTLLAALARGFRDWTGSPVLPVDLEGHGREEIFPDVDLSRTVGWFTSLYPVLLDLRETSSPGDSLKAVKEQLRRVPRGGIGYGLLRWNSRHAAALAALPRHEIVFNYLGQLDQVLSAGSPFRPAREQAGPSVSPLAPRRHLLEFNGGVFGDRLSFACTFSTGIHRRETVQRLVDAVAARLRELIDHCRAPEAGGYTPSDFPLAGLDQIQIDALASRSIEDIYHLSSMQQGMLFHTLSAPGRGVYMSQISGRILGAFDPGAFEGAWAALLDRHPVLRTSFRWEGFPHPLQVVQREVEIPLERQDWSELPEAARRERLAVYLREDLARGFQLGEPPLLRLLLVKEGERRHRLVWSTHLILMDGWSQATVLRELFALYEALHGGRPSELPASPPYRDYISWLTRQEAGEAESFWRRELSGLTGRTPLPGDLGSVGQSEILQNRIRLSPETTSALQALGRRSHLTLNTLLQGAWALLLARFGGELEVVFGATVSGRPPSLPGIESMVGLFINSLPVRTEVPPRACLLDWLCDLQERQTATRQYEHIPLVDVQGWSPLPRGTPLFESLVVFENYPAEAAFTDGGPGLTIDEVASNEVTSYPLVLVVLPGRQLNFRLHWDRSRFSGAGIQRLLLQLTSLCEAMARRPEALLEELDPLPAWERHQILAEWNDRDNAASGPFLHRLFEEQAVRRPNAMAITSSQESLTYGELHRRASGLASRLRALGVGPEAVVCLCLERTPDMVAAMLGVLAAGGAYLPLDPSYPRERMAFLLGDSGAALLLAERHLEDILPEGGPPRLWLQEERSALSTFPAGFPACETDLENLAYVIYTSGSTGRPKGVGVRHRGVVNYLSTMSARPGLAANDVMMAVTTLSFDIAVTELLLPLTVGARIELASRETAGDPALLAKILETATCMQATPATWTMLVESGWNPKPGFKALCGGEALPRALADKLLSRVGELWNVYGPTETTVWSACHRVTPGDRPVPLGLPLANTTLHLLGRWGELVPVGAAGELLIGGAGLARGYHGRPDLTAERFVPDPFGEAGSRLYRTGDLARRLPDGTLEYLGRIDFQVKARGFRIELGEIETVLGSHPEVRESVAVARDGRLIAYVVARGEARGLREYLRDRLPEYMVPSAFVFLEAFPLTPNGKVDRRALSRIEPGAPADRRGGRELAEPIGRVEHTVAAVWREVLGIEEVGRNDNFFDLGGHSLLLFQVQSQLSRDFGRGISMVDLFSHPTVSSLACLFADVERADPAPVRSAGQEERMVSGKERLRRLRRGTPAERKIR